MKKFICILLVILLLTLSGCAGMEVVSNDLYAIREKGGEHYIDFHNDEYNKTAASLKPEASSLTANFISFSSVGEMRSRILSGKFTEEELTVLIIFTVGNDLPAVLVVLSRVASSYHNLKYLQFSRYESAFFLTHVFSYVS